MPGTKIKKLSITYVFKWIGNFDIDDEFKLIKPFGLYGLLKNILEL